MRIVIIDYNSGNLHSAKAAFERVIAVNADFNNATISVSSDANELKHATHIVLPGVGAFGDCMAGLANISGMIEMLNNRVISSGVPFLGICVGMQMIMDTGYEHGKHQGLGWIKGDVLAIPTNYKTLKIPHMGWNNLEFDKPQNNSSKTLFDGVDSDSHAYFVHSYAVNCQDKSDILATVDYGGEIVAAIGKDNIFGTQFHPEKSQNTGNKVIENFLKIK